MACEHPNDRKVDDFCFACWHDEHERKRAALRRQLATLLETGATILETLPNGAMVDWLLTPFDHKVETYHHDSGRRDYAFAVPFTPEQLAEHLESRAHGFGFILQVYCSDCSDELLPIDVDKPDNDPACAKCMQRRARLAEISAAADAAEQFGDDELERYAAERNKQ